MSEIINISKTKWDELGSILEELYGMVHSLNDYLGWDQVDTARKEANEIEKEVVKALDIYNKIDRGQL